MAYGIQVIGADGTVGLQIDDKLTRIIAAGAFNLPSGTYVNSRLFLIGPINSYSTSTLGILFQPSVIDSNDYGWHFGAAKYQSVADGNWYVSVYALTSPSISHVAATINYQLIEWR